MRKELVEKLIKEGKTSQEIRRTVIGFPYRPSKEYFEKLGYESKVAKEYERILQERDSICSEERFEFIASQNVDLKNLIIDTCVFGYDRTVELLGKAENVTILLSTINEMDKKKDMNQKMKYDRCMAGRIRWNSKMFLVDVAKYHLIPFEGYEKNMYPDDVIIQYLLMTEVTKRPTILTVDTHLAVKAQCHGLEYILYNPVEFVIRKADTIESKVVKTTKIEKNKKEPITKKEKISYVKKKENNTHSMGGVEIYLEGTDVIVKNYNDNAKIFYLKEGEYTERKQEECLEQPMEFTIFVPVVKNGSIYVSKVKVEDGEVSTKSKEYFGLNEIYGDEWIDDRIKDRITDIIY